MHHTLNCWTTSILSWSRFSSKQWKQTPYKMRKMKIILELDAFSWNDVIAFGNPMTPNNIHSKIQCKQRYMWLSEAHRKGSRY